MNTNKWLLYGMLLAMGCSSSPPAGSSSPIRDLLHDTRGDLGVARNPDPTPGDVGLAPDIPSYGPDISADAIPILEDAGVQIADAAPVSDSEIPDLAVPEVGDAYVSDAVVLDPDAGDAILPDAAVIPEADAFIPPVWPRRVPGPCKTVTRDPNTFDPITGLPTNCISGDLSSCDPLSTLHYRYDDQENLILSWNGDRAINGLHDNQEDRVHEYSEDNLIQSTIVSQEIQGLMVPTKFLTYTYIGQNLLESLFEAVYEEGEMRHPDRGSFETHTYNVLGLETNFTRNIVDGWEINDLGEQVRRVGSVDQNVSYIYDDTGHIVEERRANGSTFFTYSPDYLSGTVLDNNNVLQKNVLYNEFGQVMVEEDIREEDGFVTRRETRTYDEAGNILSLLVETRRSGRTPEEVTIEIPVGGVKTYQYECWIPPNQ